MLLLLLQIEVRPWLGSARSWPPATVGEITLICVLVVVVFFALIRLSKYKRVRTRYTDRHHIMLYISSEGKKHGTKKNEARSVIGTCVFYLVLAARD